MHRAIGPQLALRGEVVTRGPSAAATRLRAALARVARTPNTTILLEGERGTHRPALAARVHALSERASEPLVSFVADVPKEYGAALDAACLAATGGTLVLAGPERLSAADQERLSRLLATRTFTSDDVESRPLDARLVVVADAGFDALVERGAVTEDLAYRLNVLRVEVPPLRERLEDVPALLGGLAELEDAPDRAPRFETESLLVAVRRHRWPGNLRELEAAWALAVARATEGRVEPAALLPASEPAPAHADDLRAVEAAWIRRVLVREGGNRSRAARTLGIHRATLHKKLREYAIEA